MSSSDANGDWHHQKSESMSTSLLMSSQHRLDTAFASANEEASKTSKEQSAGHGPEDLWFLHLVLWEVRLVLRCSDALSMLFWSYFQVFLPLYPKLQGLPEMHTTFILSPGEIPEQVSCQQQVAKGCNFLVQSKYVLHCKCHDFGMQRLKNIKAEERLYPGCIDGHKFLHISQESLLLDSEKCIPIWCCRCPRSDMSEGGSIRSFISFLGSYEAI